MKKDKTPKKIQNWLAENCLTIDWGLSIHGRPICCVSTIRDAAAGMYGVRISPYFYSTRTAYAWIRQKMKEKKR